MVSINSDTSLGLQKVKVDIRESDNLVYITPLAKKHNLRVNAFLNLPSTIVLVNKLQEKGCKTTDIKVGGDYSKQGTWVHPIVAIAFLSWIQLKRPSSFPPMSIEDMIHTVLY
jgi:hypothetical protein